MITGAPAPSPTFLGSDSFLLCGRLAFGCGSPFVDSRAGASACGGHPNPRTSHLVVASPSAAAPRSWTHALGRAPAVATRTLVLPILWSPRLRLRLPVRPSPLTLGRHRQWASGHSYFLSRGRLAFGCGSPYVPRLSPWGGIGSGRPHSRTSYRVVASPSAAAPPTSLASHPGAASAVRVRTLALPIAWSPRLRLRLPLHYRPDDPGGEFLFADAGELALRPLARGDRHDLLEDLPSHLRQRRALEDDAAVDIHVLLHVAVHERVGGELDRGHGLAAEHRAAAGGEADEVAAAGHETGDGDGIVPRRVHEDEAARGDRLAVEEHVGHRGGTALGHAAQRLLEDRGDAARLVAGGGIVVHALDAAAVPLPPLVAIDELLGHRLADRAADQEVLRAVDLGRLGEHSRAAVAHELVHRPAQGGVGGDAGGAVGPAAIGGQRDLRHRLLRPRGGIGQGQELGHLGGRLLDRLPDTARLLDVDHHGLALRVAGCGHALLVHQDRGLIHLAAEADQDVGGDVRMLGIAREHALKGHVVLAEELGAAARLVGDGEHAVDVRVVLRHVAELVLDELAHAGRAVHAGDDGDVVARRSE